MLILQTGSRAGLQAPMQHGYYMIGRHQECQIRPKSRSVSRHHCLLFLDDTGLRVFDLESTSGTRINEVPLTPKSWVELEDGDMLRCGKIVFQVCVEQRVLTELTRQHAESMTRSAVTVGAADGGGGSMLSGEAWQEVDIADYLDAEDNADRERRYDTIRERHDAKVAAEDSGVSDFVDVFSDDFDDDPATEPPEPASTTSRGGSASETPERKQSKAKRSTNRQARSGPKPARIPKKKRKRLSGSGFPLAGLFSDLERLKVLAAVLLVFVTVGLLGYSVYSYSSGPEVRVLQGID